MGVCVCVGVGVGVGVWVWVCGCVCEGTVVITLVHVSFTMSSWVPALHLFITCSIEIKVKESWVCSTMLVLRWWKITE